MSWCAMIPLMWQWEHRLRVSKELYVQIFCRGQIRQGKLKQSEADEIIRFALPENMEKTAPTV